MGTVIKELVTQGHELVALLGTQHGMHDAASLVQRLTAQLDITAVALREMTRKRDAEHDDVLTWEKTMFKVCGEDGHKSVAAKFAELEAKCAALAAENAGMKVDVPMGAIENGRAFAERLEAYPFECQGGDLNMCSDWQELRRCFDHLSEWAMHRQQETPATDAFLAEVRAQGVEMLHAVFNQAGCVGSPALHSAMNTFMLNIASKIRNGEFAVERKGASA